MSTRNAQYDDQPEAYDALRVSWLSTRRQNYIAPTVRALPDGARVLEIGSGTGGLLAALAAARPEVAFVGVEPLQSYVDFANGRAKELSLVNLRFCCGTAERLQPDDVGGEADLVLSNDVLHHVDDQAATARAARRASRTGATWLAIEPSWINPYVAWYHLRTDGEHLFFPRAFLQAASDSGWERESGRRLFLIPSVVRRPRPWMITAERVFERVPVLAGGVAVRLVAT